MIRTLIVSTLAAVLCAATPGRAPAAVESGVEFPDAIEAGGERLELCSTALLRYRIVFKGYAGGLYLGDCAKRADVLADVPKRLELSYYWSVKTEWIVGAAEKLLARNLDEQSIAALRGRLRAFHAAYRPVEPGDRYSLTYTPGIGTELALNGEKLAVAPGADFARAYFSMWLGRKPLDEGFRDALIRGGVK